MKHTTKLIIGIIVACLSLHKPALAAFIIKKSTITAPAAPMTPAVESGTVVTGNSQSSPVSSDHYTVARKKSFVSRAVSWIAAKSATVPVLLYVIMAILPLGWLAIGINEDFHGLHWLIALILYFIFYIPGVVYSLIMMGKYY
jgi:hypothetical protein